MPKGMCMRRWPGRCFGGFEDYTFIPQKEKQSLESLDKFLGHFGGILKPIGRYRASGHAPEFVNILWNHGQLVVLSVEDLNGVGRDLIKIACRVHEPNEDVCVNENAHYRSE